MCLLLYSIVALVFIHCCTLLCGLCNILIRPRDYLLYTKKETHIIVIYSPLNHDCTTFTSRKNVLNENTVRTEGIQITLYLTLISISLVRHCCFY